jgi:hypothetical protein
MWPVLLRGVERFKCEEGPPFSRATPALVRAVVPKSSAALCRGQLAKVQERL